MFRVLKQKRAAIDAWTKITGMVRNGIEESYTHMRMLYGHTILKHITVVYLYIY